MERTTSSGRKENWRGTYQRKERGGERVDHKGYLRVPVSTLKELPQHSLFILCHFRVGEICQVAAR